ncbi:MAG: ABC transporter ATP-binding protein [Candidatus Hydrogenedentota bacterium]
MDTSQLTAQEKVEQSTVKAANFWTTYSRLLRYILHYKGKLVALVLLSFIAASGLGAMLFAIPSGIDVLFEDEDQLPEKIAYYKGKAISLDNSIAQYTPWDADLQARVEPTIMAMRDNQGYALRLLAGIVIGITLLGGIARYFQEYLAGIISADVAMRISRNMYQSVIGLSHDFFESRTTGGIVARFTNDVGMVNTGLANVFVLLFREPFKIVVLLGVAFIASAKITFVILFFISPIILIFLVAARRVKQRVRFQLEYIAQVASVLMESIRGITVVKSFRMEDTEERTMMQALKNLRKQQIRFARIDAAVAPATELVLVCATGGLLFLGERLIASEGLSAGELVALAGAMIAIIDPMRKIAKMNNKVQVSAASAERIFEFIDQQATIVEADDAVNIGEIATAISFDHVDFSYDGQTPVLKDLTFEVKKGEMVALVGFSGAGKSTVAKLLPRFYDPDSGSISIDGVDIRKTTFESLREQIGYVTQENVLFNRSIRENITFGRDSYDDDRVRAAAKVAHADGFIESMSDAYDSSVSESGTNLSGGQKQRIAIARAIVKDPAILILDEATSSLDTESEAAIQEAIDEFVVGRTTIVIAHRLSTIRRADRIVVLSHGEIAEQGTHHELLEHDGIYSRLHRLQFAEMPDPNDEVA